MRTRELDYLLPPEAVAQEPVEPRHDARLLTDRGAGAEVAHRRVRDLPDLLRPGDVVVLNETRVAPARVHLRKPTGGRVEVLVTAPGPEAVAEALVRPSRRVPPESVLRDARGRDVLMVGAATPDGRRAVKALAHRSIDALLEELGEVPLPPYVHAPVAPERYQTVYARRPTSAAAPTAGLHLSEQVLAGIAAAGIGVVRLDLGISVATFRPVTAERLEDHVMHSERYEIPSDTWAACQEARPGRGGRDDGRARPRDRSRDRLPGGIQQPVHPPGAHLRRHRRAAHELPHAALDPAGAAVGVRG